MGVISEKLIKIIDARIEKKIAEKGFVKKFPAIVEKVSEDNSEITVKLAGYDTEFVFLNKTGELISVGEGVKVEMDSSGMSGAFISERFGKPVLR